MSLRLLSIRLRKQFFLDFRIHDRAVPARSMTPRSFPVFPTALPKLRSLDPLCTLIVTPADLLTRDDESLPHIPRGTFFGVSRLRRAILDSSLCAYPTHKYQTETEKKKLQKSVYLKNRLYVSHDSWNSMGVYSEFNRGPLRTLKFVYREKSAKRRENNFYSKSVT